MSVGESNQGEPDASDRWRV